ncbi:MAG: DUF2516 family protein [Acidimicrobiales bacterium]
MNLGGQELLLVGLWVAFVVLPVVAVVDVVRHPAEDFDRIGQSRATWLVLLVVTALFCGLIGTGLALYELVVVRPRLAST